MSIGIIGSVVLVDPDGEPYAAGTPSEVTTSANMLGMIMLVDPETGEPYKIGE